MTKARSQKMPTWQKMHALRSTTAPCSTSSRSKSCSRAYTVNHPPATRIASTVLHKTVAGLGMASAYSQAIVRSGNAAVNPFRRNW